MQSRYINKYISSLPTFKTLVSITVEGFPELLAQNGSPTKGVEFIQGFVQDLIRIPFLGASVYKMTKIVSIHRGSFQQIKHLGGYAGFFVKIAVKTKACILPLESYLDITLTNLIIADIAGPMQILILLHILPDIAFL